MERMEQTGQVQACQHCGARFTSLKWVFMHIFTAHWRKDIGLPKDMAKRYLAETEPYKHPVFRWGN